MNYRRNPGERLFDGCNAVLMAGLIFVTVYPFLYVVFASFSNPDLISAHAGALFWPLGWETGGYKLVFKNALIYSGYANTIFYVLVGTGINMVLTLFAAYALSRKSFLLKKTIMMGIVFTMFFSGGLIPSYLIVKGLGLYDSRLAVILPGAMSAWNMIIMRTSFLDLPDSIEESAKLDGANDFQILFRIVVPISKAVLAVMVLFYAVGHWNAWFNAMIYLNSRAKFPLQVILREILIANSTDSMLGGSDNFGTSLDIIIKYACIVVATLPVLCLYPFLQKYFVKGVMIGAVKG